MPGYYSELSHRPEVMAVEIGIHRVPVSHVAEVLGKDVEDAGNGWYLRNFTGPGGKVTSIRKRLYGIPWNVPLLKSDPVPMTPWDLHEIRQAGPQPPNYGYGGGEFLSEAAALEYSRLWLTAREYAVWELTGVVTHEGSTEFDPIETTLGLADRCLPREPR